MREDTLRAYLQQMSDLIGRRGLRSPRSDANAEPTLARTLTLIALRRLDGARKGLVVQFLKEADLINTTAVSLLTRYGLERDPTSLGTPRVSLGERICAALSCLRC